MPPGELLEEWGKGRMSAGVFERGGHESCDVLEQNYSAKFLSGATVSESQLLSRRTAGSFCHYINLIYDSLSRFILNNPVGAVSCLAPS